MTREGLTTAFWSYAHADNVGLGGQIERLKEHVDHAFQRHSGEALKSFFDRHSLEWGEEWRTKISSTISGTTFFIAVLSPSYLKSTNCREEFMEFWNGANGDSDLTELLLPILWVPAAPETEAEKRVWELAQQRQWIDWTKKRRLEESDISYVNLIDDMGERIAHVARNLRNKPEGAPSEPEADRRETSITTAELDPTGPDEPGLLEMMAESEGHARALTESINSAFAALKTMTADVTAAPLSPTATSTQRILHFRKIAHEITPYTTEFEEKADLAADSARSLSKAGFKMLAVIKTVPQLRDSLPAQNTVQVQTMIDELSAKLSFTPEMRAQLAGFGRLSRDLREPFDRIERGFNSLDAVKTLIADLVDAFTSGGPLADPPPAE
ncbi:toll/interleukin-1 receptor domain-containing protein [Mycobacteroides abscessus subsp. abscessus]|uniref:toll/interleukin-1 receptor domain-containing protein n=1 Tax=Mycobacteroides abscessus TaxID=36809 RepID=UPI0039EE0E86